MSYRIIVSDLDGCLLHSDGSLPKRFKETFELMMNKGVLFAAASGRSLSGVLKPFEAYADRMAFITDNGARVWYKGKIIFEKTIKYEDYYPLIAEIKKHEGLLAVACGVKDIWIEDTDRITPEIEKELKKYYPSWKPCKFDSLPDEVIKFALLYFDDIEKNIYPDFQKYDNEGLCVQVTAYVWIDIYKKGVSKGIGIDALQKSLGIGRAETVVFGDYLNDISMKEFSDRSFAPLNAHPKVKECFTDVIGYSEDESVANTIVDLLSNA